MSDASKQAVDALQELTDTELDQILGADDGAVSTVSHECHMNTWQFMFTCC